MVVKQSVSQCDSKNYDTKRLREELLVENVFGVDKANYYYSHFDRIIFGGAIPKNTEIKIEAGKDLRAEYFLQRREMGILNLGGDGKIVADGSEYAIKKYDCLYLGLGVKDIRLMSDSADDSAYFYFNSCPAHKKYPTAFISKDRAVTVHLGSGAECNERIIYKYILPGNVESCQLVMGVTILKEGSVWNTMPCHTHERRMEVYLYFDIKRDNAVFHFLGAKDETRHIIINEKQAVISPSWSIHSGCGTANYSFVWGMCGENQDFDDMDAISTTQLR